MGLLDTLNKLTNDMNNIADKVTGTHSNMQFNGDITKLGNINTDNANGNLISPEYHSSNNITIIDVDYSKYTNSFEYSMYLKNLLASTQDFSIVEAEDGLKVDTNNNNIFYANNVNGTNYLIISGIDCNELLETANRIIDSNIVINNTSKVIIGYFNFNNDIVQKLKNSSFELIGINEINEINSIATSKFLPDLNFGNTQIMFKSTLAKSLKNINFSGQKTGIDGVIETLENKVSSLENNIENVINTNDNTNTTPVSLTKTDNNSKVSLVKTDSNKVVSLTKTEETIKHTTGVKLHKDNGGNNG